MLREVIIMNQEQREYTVTQIRKNNDESKELAKIAANRAFMLGITTITTILAFGNLFLVLLFCYFIFFKNIIVIIFLQDI